MGATVSSYSLVTAVVVYNILLTVIYLLRKKSPFLVHCGTGVMLFVTLLAIIRLLSPLDLSRAYVIQSEKILPAVKYIAGFSPFEAFPALNLRSLAVAVWMAGTCFYVGKYVHELRVSAKTRRDYTAVHNDTAEQVVERLGIEHSVVISKQVGIPYVAGFSKPVIYLPDIALPQKSWEYILRHESQHIREGDAWIKLFYAAIEAVMWWNPVSHLFMRTLDSVLEQRCDWAIVGKASGEERWEYFNTLYVVLKAVKAKSPEAAGLCFSRKDEEEEYIKERFARLEKDKQPTLRAKLAACVIALTVFILSYFVVIQPFYAAPLEAGMGRDAGDYLYADNQFQKGLSSTDLLKDPYNTLPVYGG